MEQKSSFAQILARHRERLGDPVSLEEIFALHDVALGDVDLSEEERSDLLERVSADPEAAKRLLNLMRFPENEREEAETVESVESSWKVFRQRMRSEVEAERVPGISSFDLKLPPSVTRFRVWPLAASFFTGVLLMSWIAPHIGPGTPPKDTVSRSWVNMPIVELVDDGSDLSREPSTVRLSALSRGLVITLYTSNRNLPESGPFNVQVSTPDDFEVQLISGLEPGPGGVFVLGLPGEILTDGPHRLELRYDDKTLAVFFLDLALSK